MQKKLIALFGGSFNPPHEGHLLAAMALYEQLPVDEVWMSFSISPWKAEKDYASLEHRMAMGRLLASQYKANIIMSREEETIAQKIGTYESYAILRELKKNHPDKDFVFAIGADAFLNLHAWEKVETLMAENQIVVLARPSYDLDQAIITQKHKDKQITTKDLGGSKKGWLIVDNVPIEVSSTEIRQVIKDGASSGLANKELMDYILKHHLYDQGAYHET